MLSTLNKGIRIGILGLIMAWGMPALAASESDEYLAEARAYLAKGKTREAVIQLKNSLSSDPSNANARLVLGMVYLRTGDADGAAKELARAGRLGMPKQKWLVGLGQALIMQKDFRGILEQIQPDESMEAEQRATALAIRGNAYIGLGDRASASAAYEEALAVQKSNPLARPGKAPLLLQEGEVDQAVQQFTEVLADYPEHAETRLARGDLYRGQGKYQEAIADFDVVIEQAPQDVRAYIGRGLANIALGKKEEAREDIQVLTKRAEELPITHYLAALVAFQDQDFDKASQELQLVLRSAPNNYQSQLLYGVVSYARGQYRIAEDYLARALQRAQGNVQLAKLLGASRLKLKDYAGALAVLEPLLDGEAEPDAQTLALLGSAHMLSGDSAKGAEYMNQAVKLAPDQAFLRTQLAAGQIALGDTESAISTLQAAVDLGQDLIQADVLLVLSHLERKQFEEAVQAATDLEQRMPDSPIPPNLTGLAYLAQNKFVEAEKKFNEALSIDAGFVVADMNLARLSMAAEKPEEARRHYQDVLKKHPEHIGAMMGLASIEAAAGKQDEAERWVTKANQADPKALQPILVLADIHLRRNEGLKASTLLSGLTEQQANAPEALRLRGMAQLQAGNFSAAASTLRRLVNEQPGNIEGWFQLARAQAASGDAGSARGSFDRAIALDKDHQFPLLWIGKGELELREKRFPQALAVGKEMQEHFPDNAMAYEIEAAAHRGLGDINQALGAVEKAVRVEGNSQRINLFAHTLATAGQAPKAVFMLRDWLEQNPEDGPSWTTLGMMLQQMGRQDEALEAYESALKFADGNPVVLNNMAWLYLDRDLERAAGYAKKAYDIAPERAEIVDTYGWVMFKQGKQREALNILQQALVIAPRNAEIGLHVAEALLRQGREAEARPLLERILAENPHTQYELPARELLKRLGN
jgi:putative PEP-CTERM system TPR-repeat lipoprotein